MFLRLLLIMLLLPTISFGGEATPAPAADAKVLFKGRFVTQEEKAKLEQGLVL